MISGQNNVIHAERKLKFGVAAFVTLFFAGLLTGMIKVTGYFLDHQDKWSAFVTNTGGLWAAFLVTLALLSGFSLLITRLFLRIYSRVKDSGITFEAVVEQANDAIVVADFPGRNVLFANNAFTSLTGKGLDTIKGKPLASVSLIPPVQIDAMVNAACVEGRDYSTEFTTHAWDGRQLTVMVNASAIKLKDRTLASFIVRDVSQKREAEEALRHSTLHDPLTGLPNRQLFSDRMKMALAQARRSGGAVGIIYLDLDNFKEVCESFGHKAGDELLKQVAARIQGLLREGDTVARQGGDEFMILLAWVSNASGAGQVAERLISSFKQPFIIDGQDIHTSASIGISMFPADGANGDELLQRADIAMYQAKRDGRNSFALFDKTANASVMSSFHTRMRMTHALKNNEFVLYYQPQVDVATGIVNGVEALIRWMDPERGLVPPCEFIPIAEQTGFISVLSDWVVETACQQGRKWRDAGLPKFRIAVNLSARQFHNQAFVDSISGSIRNAGLEPGILELEITETTAMKSESNTRLILELFKQQGILITLDDFGTGYSSLSYLRTMPFDTIKIDRSFIGELPRRSADQAIVAGIIDLAHRLDIKVVAEGVETGEQLSILRGHGCDSVQGFGLCKPAPENDISEFLKTVKDPIGRLLQV